MPWCAGCDNHTRDIHAVEGLSFHKFPRDKFLRRKWEEAVSKNTWKSTATSVLCSCHFKYSDFDRSSTFRTFLKKGVIPSIFEHSQGSAEDEVITNELEENDDEVFDNGKCYLCDAEITENKTPLAKCVDFSSKTSFREIIDNIANGNFSIASSNNDIICQKCADLLRHIHTLEQQWELQKNNIIGELVKKNNVS